MKHSDPSPASYDGAASGEPERPATITRRETLRRIGIVGAAAWTAPIVSSFNVPAFAQEGTPRCTECGNAPGATPHCPQPPCGDGCTCLETAAGDCFCHQSVNCGHPDVRDCATDDDCPDGWRCARSCCAGGRLLCHPPCGIDPDELAVAENEMARMTGSPAMSAGPAS